MFQCPGVVGPTQTRLSGIKGGRDMKLDKVGLEGWEESEKKYVWVGKYDQNKFYEIIRKLIKKLKEFSKILELRSKAHGGQLKNHREEMGGQHDHIL